MSGGLAPSKSTVYVGNLPFSLTNNDIHKVFEKFGRIAKVTILRDKVSRESKGVAFVQFIDRDSAVNACKEVNQKVLFDRKIKCVIAKDNGRTTEFIKRKIYPDKSSCYECGEEGHLSYVCPKNLLGEREPPTKKERKEKKQLRHMENVKRKKLLEEFYSSEEDGICKEQEDVIKREEFGLSDAISLDAEENYADDSVEIPKKKIIKRSSYFSDEEEEEDNAN